MTRTVNFIDWSEPAGAGFSSYLLKGYRATPPDLSDTLVLAPTRQAGRKLRESLAKACAGVAGGLLAPRVLTPNSIFETFSDQYSPPSSAIVEALWTRTLFNIEIDEYRYLFPKKPAALEGRSNGALSWAFGMGARIEALRNELSLSGLNISSVLASQEDEMEEAERWRDLQRLERVYIENLNKLDFTDRSSAQLELARNPRVPNGFQRLVLAAVADLSPLLEEMIGNISKSIDVDIVVHAPENMRDDFDDWGRPKPSAWRDRMIEIPAPEQNIILAEDPYGQADRIIEIISDETGNFGPDDITIGVPDQSIADLAAHRLQQHGLQSFNPAGKPLGNSATALVLEAFRDLSVNADIDTLRRFITQALVINQLASQNSTTATELLKQFDKFNERHVPLSLESMRDLLASEPDGYQTLNQALKTIDGWLDDYRVKKLEQFLPEWLELLIGDTPIEENDQNRHDYFDPVKHIGEALEGLKTVDMGAKERQNLDFVVQHLKGGISVPKRGAPAIEMLGWVELLWDDAPLLMVTGMNEGHVPEHEVSDIFLPDSLRARLGLPNDESKLTRDAYFMEAICGTRREKGRAVFICGHTSASGDPLKPSRLLFRCPNEQLASRAMRLFNPQRGGIAFSKPERNFKLDLAPEGGRRPGLPSHLSPSAINDYLACPFRFYLKRILNMQKRNPYKSELDAADYGNIIHGPLCRMGRSTDDSIYASPDSLADYLESECRYEADKIYGMQKSLAVEIQIETAVKRLRSLAPRQIELVEEGWEISAAEVKVSMEFEGVLIEGRIDRIDRNLHTNALRLIDYKTANKGQNPYKYHLGSNKSEHREYRHCGDKSWINLQLPLYLMMWRDSNDAKSNIELGIFNIPKAEKDIGLDIWDKFDDEILSSARDCLAGAVADITNFRFWPPSEKVDYDDFEKLFPQGIEMQVNAKPIKQLYTGEAL